MTSVFLVVLAAPLLAFTNPACGLLRFLAFLGLWVPVALSCWLSWVPPPPRPVGLWGYPYFAASYTALFCAPTPSKPQATSASGMLLVLAPLSGLAPAHV